MKRFFLFRLVSVHIAKSKPYFVGYIVTAIQIQIDTTVGKRGWANSFENTRINFDRDMPKRLPARLGALDRAAKFNNRGHQKPANR